jgi:hypothetical protein
MSGRMPLHLHSITRSASQAFTYSDPIANLSVCNSSRPIFRTVYFKLEESLKMVKGIVAKLTRNYDTIITKKLSNE